MKSVVLRVVESKVSRQLPVIIRLDDWKNESIDVNQPLGAFVWETVVETQHWE